jgi:hypothetical protein
VDGDAVASKCREKIMFKCVCREFYLHEDEDAKMMKRLRLAAMLGLRSGCIVAGGGDGRSTSLLKL